MTIEEAKKAFKDDKFAAVNGVQIGGLAEGSCTCIYNIDVTDGLGRDIARFIGTGFKL